MLKEKSSKTMKSLFACFCAQNAETDGEVKRHRRRMVMVGDGECGKSCVLTRMKSGKFNPDEYRPTVFETEVLDVNTGEEEVELIVNDTAGQEEYDRLRPLSYTDIDVAIICFSLADSDSLANVSDKWSPEVRYFCGDIPVILVGNKKDIRDTPYLDQTDSFFPRNQCNANYGSQDTTDSLVSSVSTQTDECHLEKLIFSRRMDKRLDSYRVANRTPSKNSLSKPLVRHKAPVHNKDGAHMARNIGAVAYFETSSLTGDNLEGLLQAVAKAAMLGRKKSKKFKPLAETIYP